MDTTLAIAIIGGIQAAVVALISGIFARDNKERKKMHDATEARAAIRAEESRLSMSLMSADMSLTLATARAIKEGKTNGKMDAALAAAETAQKEYYDFINSIAAKQIIK
ncbi:hypothetical protein LJC34_02815 [Oscillospiraceae bacterium OttesenSCG-928-G22]|nr:hypothetical protein [Oscillospiraceae bacterium OttesenSCG-928-G22]